MAQTEPVIRRIVITAIWTCAVFACAISLLVGGFFLYVAWDARREVAEETEELRNIEQDLEKQDILLDDVHWDLERLKIINDRLNKTGDRDASARALADLRERQQLRGYDSVDDGLSRISSMGSLISKTQTKRDWIKRLESRARRFFAGGLALVCLGIVLLGVVVVRLLRRRVPVIGREN